MVWYEGLEVALGFHSLYTPVNADFILLLTAKGNVGMIPACALIYTFSDLVGASKH